MKKFLFTLIALISVFTASAATRIGKLYYNLDANTKTAEVTYFIYSSTDNANYVSGELSIPTIVSSGGINYTVTSIGRDAFYYCSGLTSVEIPNSVTSIGDAAFVKCSGLTSIEIPNSVTSIGNNAFNGCSGLTSIEIPNSVTSIEYYAFNDCSGLTSVEVPNSVTSIGDGAFKGCSCLTSVEIPNSVTSIGDGAFKGCSGLTSVEIPNSVISIGSSAFEDCRGLTSIEIPNSVTSIGNSTFNGCSGLTSIEIPNSVTSIGDYAFNNCSGLTSVEIPNSVTSIGKYAFSHCSGLTSVEIPNLVTSIGNGAFNDCSGLTSVEIPNSVTSIGSSAFYGCSGLTSVEIPNSVTSIGKYAFEDCSGITSIEIPNSVTSIGDWAFSKCSGLTSVEIPNSVTSISHNAFNGCSGLTSVEIPNSVTSIGTSAFEDCSGLTSVEIPNSVTSIGTSAFEDCSGLTSVEIPNSVTEIGNWAFYKCSGLTCVEIPNSVTSIGTSAFAGCNGLIKSAYPSSIINPFRSGIAIQYPQDGVIEENGVIYDSSKTNLYYVPIDLEGKLELANTVTTIHEYALYNCNKLIGSLIIPSSVISIGNNAFAYATSFSNIICETLTVPPTADSAFEGWPSATQIYVLPQTYNLFIQSSPWNKFNISIVNADVAKCIINGLMFIINKDNSAQCIGFDPEINTINPILNIPGEIEYDKSHYIVREIDSYAFNEVTQLKSVIIPSSVKIIGKDAFLGCTELIKNAYPNTISNPFPNGKSIEYPNDAIITGDYIYNSVGDTLLFVGLDMVETVTIPASVNTIGEYAFYGCNKVTSIEIPNSVTSIRSYAFQGCSGLTSVVIPPSVTSVGSGAFSGCTGLIKSAYPNNLSNPFANGVASPYPGAGSIVDNGVIYGANKSSINFVPVNIEGTFIIPETVKTIGESSFAICSKIADVEIPESVTTIEASAFQGCIGIKAINIPSGVNSISNNAFAGCSNLSSLRVEDGTTTITIGDGSFGTNQLETLYMGRNWTYGSSTKAISTSLKEVTLGENVTAIPAYAFSNCTGLTSVEIPNSVTSIDSYAFSGCTGLTAINIPSGVESIGNNIFSGCTNLTSLRVDNATTTITIADGSFGTNQLVTLYMGRNWTYGTSAKALSTSLEEVTLGENVTEIPAYAFYDCKNLTQISIPAGVISIGDNAFDGSGLNELEYLATNCSTFGINVFPTGISKLTIGNSVQSIPAGFLGRGNNLQVLDIPNSVRSIGVSAFYNSKELRSLYVGTGILEFSPAVLYDVAIENNTTVAVNPYTIPKVFWLGNTPPAGYRQIEAYIHYVANSRYEFDEDVNSKVYQYLSSKYMVDGIVYVPLQPSERTTDAVDCTYDTQNETITVPSTVENMGIALSVKNVADYAFYNNTFTVSMSAANSGYFGNYAAYINSNLQNVSLNNSGSVGDYAFYGDSKMSKLIIANTGSLGKSAFQNCTSLPEVEIPNSIDSMGVSCFENCSALTKVKIGINIEELPERVFANCYELPELSIPENVMAIRDYAFYGDRSLSRVIFEDSDDDIPTTLGSNGSDPLFHDCPLDYVYIGCNILYDSTAEKGYSPFYHNVTLREVEITDRETQIYENEFYLCIGLKTIRIGNGVTTIGKWAFSGCSSLEYYSAGYKVEAIHEEAFSDCVGITEYYSYSSVPPVCGEQALDDINKWNCKLFVPATAVGLYQAAPQWKDFFFVEGLEIPAEGIVMSNESLILYMGDTYTLRASWVPENATVTTVKWESSDTAVATVDANGQVAAIGAGEAVISVYSPEYPEAKGYCTVRVLDNEEVWYDFVLSVSMLELKPEETYTINVLPLNDGTVVPDNIAWSSSDESVATVENGVIITYKEGAVEIKAVGVDAEGNPIVNPDGSTPTRSCSLTVFTQTLGVTGVEADTLYDVYDFSGRTLMLQVGGEELKTLSPGFYIINGRKVVIR